MLAGLHIQYYTLNESAGGVVISDEVRCRAASAQPAESEKGEGGRGRDQVVGGGAVYNEKKAVNFFCKISFTR